MGLDGSPFLRFEGTVGPTEDRYTGLPSLIVDGRYHRKTIYQ